MHRLALIPLVFTSACVASSGDEGFEILHNLAITGDECSAMPGGAFLAHGRVDANSPSGYVLSPEMSSRITVTDNQNQAQRTIALRGAKIDVTNAVTGTSVGKLTALFAGSLFPNSQTAVIFEAISPAILSQFAGGPNVELVAKITPYGALGGTDEIDGVPFYYPVTVCGANCVAFDAGACPLPPMTVPGTANACNSSQDGGGVLCCHETLPTGQAGPLVCPGRVGT